MTQKLAEKKLAVLGAGKLGGILLRAYVKQELFSPGLRKMGGFQGAAALATPNPLLAYNTGAKFPTDLLRASYKAASASPMLTTSAQKMSDAEIADWVGKLR